MTVNNRSTTLMATSALVAALVGGCSSSATKDSAQDHAGSHVSTSSSTNSKTSTSTSNAKCTDLTTAAARAAVGKTVAVTLLTSGAAGETNCSIKAGVDPNDPDAFDAYYGLDVRPNEGQATFNDEKQAIGGTSVAGVGDQAFTSTAGLAVLSHGVVIEVSGPRSSGYAIPTAIAKAMIATLR